MEGMQGWPSAAQFGAGSTGGHQVPPPDVARIAARDGSVPLGIGVVLLLIAGVLGLLTFRNPSFDPAGMSRVAMDEGRATIDVSEPGYYVVYIETPDCSSAFVQFTQSGQPVAQSTPASGARYPQYHDDQLCGIPLGLYALTASGPWIAASQEPLAGNLAFYLDDDSPTRIEAGTLWLGVAFLLAGGVLTAWGLTQRRRWQRVNAAAQQPR
jgi:hypothetical protein